MTENGNPFRTFWENLAKRGERIQRLKGYVRYRITLTDDEVHILAYLTRKYAGVKSTIARTDGNTVDFYYQPAKNLADKRNLKPKKR